MVIFSNEPTRLGSGNGGTVNRNYVSLEAFDETPTQDGPKYDGGADSGGGGAGG